jgi:hypothetical protein
MGSELRDAHRRLGLRVLDTVLVDLVLQDVVGLRQRLRDVGNSALFKQHHDPRASVREVVGDLGLDPLLLVNTEPSGTVGLAEGVARRADTSPGTRHGNLQVGRRADVRYAGSVLP